LLEAGESGRAGAYFAYLFISLLFAIVASLSVAIGAPSARGGGVPFVFAYLNGTNVMEYFSLRIVLVKSFALIWTIAAGLTQGMEGPFVFIGGGVAAILNKAMDIVFPFFPRHSSYAKIIRGIREERIFMAGGMAAGLAVAFDAPIAGVLFALEGATAFLSAPVVLRIFGCAMFASFFNDLGHTNFSRYIRNHNLLSVSNSGEQSAYAWTLLEVFPFIVIALTGGVVGAYATKINMVMSRWRHHAMQGTSARMGQCVHAHARTPATIISRPRRCEWGLPFSFAHSLFSCHRSLFFPLSPITCFSRQASVGSVRVLFLDGDPVLHPAFRVRLP
jgi:H+/Cl- antiporter ClcA